MQTNRCAARDPSHRHSALILITVLLNGNLKLGSGESEIVLRTMLNHRPGRTQKKKKKKRPIEKEAIIEKNIVVLTFPFYFSIYFKLRRLLLGDLIMHIFFFSFGHSGNFYVSLLFVCFFFVDLF